MNLRYLLTTIGSLVTTVAAAQVNANSFIGFSAGASIPVGAFAKADAGTFDHWNNTAGFAKTGFMAGVEGAYYFLPQLGLGGTVYYSEHGGFSNSDVNKLGASYTEAFGVDQSTVTTRGKYSSLNVLVGPYVSFPMNKFTVNIRAMAGLVKSLSTPVMNVVLEDSGNTFPFSQSSSTASAFGWQVGAGVRYGLTERWGLSLRADYFQSGGVAVENVNRTNNAGRRVTRQPMAWMNGSLGLTYALTGK